MSLKSIFDLPTSKDQLEPSNNSFANYKWIQKAPLRNIADTDNQINFNRGEITYRWDLASSTYFMPSKCFLRVRCSLTDGAGNPLTQQDGIGPSMGLVPNLMNEMNLTINDQQISVADRHIGEIESLYTRLNKSGQWMRKNDCGGSVNMWESNLQKRINDVASDSLDVLNESYGSRVPSSLRSVGIFAPNQVEVTIPGAVNTLIFTQNGGRAIPDLRNILKVGDPFFINQGANLNITRNILTVSADRITVDGAVLNAQGPDNISATNYQGVTEYQVFGQDITTGQAGNVYDRITIQNGNEIVFTRNAGGLTSQDISQYFRIGDVLSVDDQVAPNEVKYVTIRNIKKTGGMNTTSEYDTLVVDGPTLANVPAEAFSDRVMILNKGNIKVLRKTRNLKDFEVNWTPRCLSFFRLPHAIPGGAKFQLNMTPKNLYREAGIQSLVNKSAGTDFNFKILSMFLYIPTFEGKPHLDKYSFYLDLNEIRCQKISITSQETPYTVDVRPSTNAICCAVQSSAVDNDTNRSSSIYTAEDDYQLKLRSFHVRYSGSQKPIPDFDIDYSEADGIDYWNEIYMRNLLATNAYFDSSCESIKEFYERGNYIYQVWNRSADDRETRLYVKAGFSEAPPATNPKLLIWNFYKKYGIVRLDNGRYQEILINEA